LKVGVRSIPLGSFRSVPVKENFDVGCFFEANTLLDVVEAWLYAFRKPVQLDFTYLLRYRRIARSSSELTTAA